MRPDARERSARLGGRRLRVFSPALLLSLTAMCCDDVAITGVLVRVTDASTGRAPNATVTARAADGDFVETYTYGLQDARELTFPFAHERPGRYTVTVSAPGYRRHTQGGVEVEDGWCHVKTTRLDIALIPLAAPRAGVAP